MGGLISRANRLLNKDPYTGITVQIHNVPYSFERRLGSGGFGSVYQAKRLDGRPVAIKVINLNGLPPARSQNLVRTYLNEVAHLERLRQESRHVVVIHDFDFDARSGQGYIVMELGGENLLTLINRLRQMNNNSGPSIDPVMIKEFWHQMVSIVRTLHAHQIIHMDLKPDNLILFGRTLKIADLGISRKADSLGHARMGTPFFSAPEVMQDVAGLQRFYGPKADIWSLGAILYFMVYGRPPTYHALASNPPVGQPAYPDPSVNDILRRTLVPNPQSRADINALIFHPYTRS
ncbi:unnamed protein product [Adineta steineri]|uniref:Protein kinase domain-containing protein n=1 Tax=Adineta steineri TaxID=433720 RepID=A0A818XS19_9BILA|nr:unnamed protein product [Adineta steineri]CAF1096709.1 unnamed protein product [Adineta steineri]CAF1128939.1 unnamed protein product [Adineta steineri]CAF3604831.1 unnamed protein product [Adineta steineri]CAF3740707.1 unnamed protein product [Adineta steineri]